MLNLRSIVKTRLFHTLFYRFIRFYSSTFHMKVENENEWMDHCRSGGRVLLCAWHQQFFVAIRHFQNYRGFNPSLMISKSADGDIIAGVAEKSGWHTVRGSSSRGGKEALKKLIDRLAVTGLAGHIVDGPKGPAGHVKAGRSNWLSPPMRRSFLSTSRPTGHGISTAGTVFSFRNLLPGWLSLLEKFSGFSRPKINPLSKRKGSFWRGSCSRN